MNYGILAAINAMKADNYVPFDDETAGNNSLDAEKMLIMKDNFEKKLSPEARLTIQIILSDLQDAPMRRTGISWSQVREFLRKHTSFTGHTITKVRMEIKIWLKETM